MISHRFKKLRKGKKPKMSLNIEKRERTWEKARPQVASSIINL